MLDSISRSSLSDLMKRGDMPSFFTLDKICDGLGITLAQLKGDIIWMKRRQELKEQIYGLMNGLLDLENHPVEESRFVEDEFTEDKICGIAYHEVMEANMRLCERLCSEKGDPDVDIIIDRMMCISYHLCMKMFDYGEFFSDM